MLEWNIHEPVGNDTTNIYEQQPAAGMFINN